MQDANGNNWIGALLSGSAQRISANDTDYDETGSIEIALIAGCSHR